MYVIHFKFATTHKDKVFMEKYYFESYHVVAFTYKINQQKNFTNLKNIITIHLLQSVFFSAKLPIVIFYFSKNNTK